MTKRYVITGGGGFVGKALAKALRARGDEVVSIARGAYPELEALGVTTVRADIGDDPSAWREAFRGATGVFHTAAKVDMWGDYSDFFRVNVLGTRNVLDACRLAGVRNVVFTSSPSVIHDGTDLKGVDESYPYPAHFEAHYPKTKAQAEQEALAASDGSLRCVALRPHLIWGPEDTNLVPTILERARAGRLTRIGRGENLVDLTFIDDCVRAHILAMRALEEDRQQVFGKAYFITQGDPINMWDWINEVVERNGLPRIKKSLPVRVAMPLAYVMEGVAKVARICGVRMKPLLTRFLVSEMATHHYFSIEAARRDLGYIPSCTVAEAMVKTFGGDNQKLYAQA